MTTERIADQVKNQHESTSFSPAFLHFQEEIEYFGARVLPLLREIENSEQDSVDSPVLVSA